MSSRKTAAGCLCLLSIAVGGSAAFADSAAQCGDRSEWTAKHREWMTRRDAWCAVEVGFRYAGSSGDIKLAIKKQAAGHAAPASLASVHLPSNGGETSEFQFIFPCAAERGTQMCLVYEVAADALELSYDYLELGADTDAQPDSASAPDAIAIVGTASGEHPAAAPSPVLSSSHRPATADQAHSILRAAVAADAAAPVHFAQRARHDFALIEPAPPVAVPITELRRRAR